LNLIARIMMGVSIAAASGLAAGVLSSQPDSYAGYLIAVERADSGFHVASERCERAAAQDRRSCVANALADRWRAIAAAEVKLNDTPDSRHTRRMADAGGALLVALTNCSSMPAWEQRMCRDQAKEVFQRAVSRARLLEARERECAARSCTPQPSGPAQSVPRTTRV
jgi:hypothetical protein